MFDLLGTALSNLLGSKSKNGKSQILEMIAEALKGKDIKLEELEAESEELFQERLELEYEDLKNAREMQIEALKQNDVFAKRFQMYMSGGILAVACLSAMLPMFVEIPEANAGTVQRCQDFLFMVSGGSIITFYYGSKSKKQN